MGYFEFREREFRTVGDVEVVGEEPRTDPFDTALDLELVSVDIHRNGDLGGICIAEFCDVPEYERNTEQEQEYGRDVFSAECIDACPGISEQTFQGHRYQVLRDRYIESYWGGMAGRQRQDKSNKIKKEPQ